MIKIVTIMFICLLAVNCQAKIKKVFISENEEKH